MGEYRNKLVNEMPYDMEGNTRAREAIHLFNTNDRADKLPEEKAQLFHHIVAKLLYLCRRTQQDIQTAVQVEPVFITMIYQDNKSTILLSKNGKTS